MMTSLSSARSHVPVMPYTETASVPHASLKTSNARDSAQPSAPSSDTSLSNAETLRLFSQFLDVKFDQRFAAFKCDLEDKEATTQSQLKKLKTETKVANSFTFKGNKVQYELNISLHDLVDSAIKNTSKGNLSAAISELESVKTLITKRNKLIRFADKSPAGWEAVEEYESDELAEDSEDEKKLRSAERRALAKIREKKRRISSARPSYTSTRQPSNEVSSPGSSNTFPVNQQLFRGQSFRECRPQPSDKYSVAGREVIGQIQLPAPAALEELLQSLQEARPQTDNKHKVTLQRLGKDEYNLLNLVTCLNDFDPVELVKNSVDAPDLSGDVIRPEYQEGVPIVKVKGSLKRNVAFWEHIGASRFIRDTIVFGYKIPFIYNPPAASFGNNRSAIQHSEFVEQAISDLLVAASVVECGCVPTVVNPLSVSIQANDASATGYAAFIAIDYTLVSHINWDSLQMNQRSTWRELHCVSFALKSFAHLLSGCDVKWFTDNQAVPSIVHSGSMKEHLHILALDIFHTAKDNKIDIEVEWIPRTQNGRADYLSKILDYEDWTVKDCYFHAVTSVWGPCSVDCFASYKNCKVPRFYSKYFNPDSLVVSSLAFSWKIAHLKDSELRKLVADLPLRTIESKAPSTTDRYSRALQKFREWSSPHNEVVCQPSDEISIALYLESLIQGVSPYSSLPY
ncbi:hypothetical protein AWC38_SpisGene8944 [Stylophora pistillata]|uniref:RNase H type-1 domain-containing protein n=1 Tax=Stylophora pistillata TaxID=50429 RepID=A0A2B4SCU6_STYPI|nr:hypothetical protein AWC38_SpisGene8944 [Stylophora pistillata]